LLSINHPSAPLPTIAVAAWRAPPISRLLYNLLSAEKDYSKLLNTFLDDSSPAARLLLAERVDGTNQRDRQHTGLSCHIRALSMLLEVQLLACIPLGSTQ
jgi:hypothetical protein